MDSSLADLIEDWHDFDLLVGTATAGPLTGRRLAPIQHVDAFWFAWAAFNPATTIWETP